MQEEEGKGSISFRLCVRESGRKFLRFVSALAVSAAAKDLAEDLGYSIR